MRTISILMVLGLGLSAAACGDDDAHLVPDAGADAGGDGDGDGDATCTQSGVADDDAGTQLDVCEPLATDYAPGADDEWEACISDDGEYHPIEASIGTIARIEAFEAIADLLWENSGEPSSADFLAARMLYQEDEGLDSRVVRRYDAHVEAPDGTDCAMPEAVEAEPEYCVGPSTLQPILLGALNAGIEGDAPREQAARIEAALLWFLYVSPFKESLTCTDVAKDCDSAYAYYTGGEAARGGIGLARYIEEVAPDAHEAAWDGLLAVRCWRDLDDAVPATDTDLRDLAREQYDHALLRGMAAILRGRLVVLAEQGCDGAQRADLAFVTTLAPLIEGSLRARSASATSALIDALDGAGAELDFPAAIAALDDALACP